MQHLSCYAYGALIPLRIRTSKSIHKPYSFFLEVSVPSYTAIQGSTVTYLHLGIKTAVIEDAKKKLREYVALDNCFPSHDECLRVASSYLSEAIATRMAGKPLPDDGESHT